MVDVCETNLLLIVFNVYFYFHFYYYYYYYYYYFAFVVVIVVLKHEDIESLLGCKV